MKNFIPELLKKKIIIISDFVDLEKYTKQELDDELNFIDTVKREVAEYGVKLDYVELKNLDELKKTLLEYDKTKIVIFNWCEFLEEKEGTAHLVTRYLEENGYIFTGADTRCILLTNSKERTKLKLLDNNVTTPKYYVINSASDLSVIGRDFPLMLKLEDRHSSAGITNENVVYNVEQLSSVSQRLINNFHTDVFVEEYIDGQEYTATVWGNGSNSSLLNCFKVNFVDPKIGIIDTESSKFKDASKEHENTKIEEVEEPKVVENVSKCILETYKALNFLDYGRFELREKNGAYYVIDCNPNPWLGMDAILFKGTKKLGYNFGETLLQICEFAVKRNMQ
jgi:D-alanine-D-alanine ligase-like ATP-grasp enzyme